MSRDYDTSIAVAVSTTQILKLCNSDDDIVVCVVFI